MIIKKSKIFLPMDYESKNLSTESLSFDTQAIDERPNDAKSRLSKGLMRSFICKQQEWFKKPDYTRNIHVTCEFKNLRLESSDGTMFGSHIYNSHGSKYFAVVLHGRQTNRYQFSKKFPITELVSRGFCLMVPDIRGFADSGTEYDARKTYLDVERCCEYLRSAFQAPEVHVITHGTGAGPGLAYFSQQHTKSRLILIAPCTSEYDLAASAIGIKLVRTILREKQQPALYDHLSHKNISYMQTLDRNKVSVVHGVKDRHVPYEHGLLLANTAGCKLYRSENDDHFSILNNLDVIDILNNHLTTPEDSK